MQLQSIKADPAADEQMAAGQIIQEIHEHVQRRRLHRARKCTVPRASLGWVAVGKKAEGDTDYTFILHTCT